jgi:NADPH2:quinone reductase
VIGVVSNAEKAAVAAGNGYDDVVVVPRGDDRSEALGGRRFDVVLESGGAARRDLAFGVLRPLGRVVAFGNASGGDEPQPPPSSLRTTNTGVLGFSLSSLIRDDIRAARRGWDGAQDLLETCRPDPITVAAPSDVVTVHREMEAGRQVGKAVVDLTSLAHGWAGS